MLRLFQIESIILAGEKINVTEKLKFVLGRIESIVGNVENTCYQHFLCFPQCFQKVSCTGLLKVVIVVICRGLHIQL